MAGSDAQEIPPPSTSMEDKPPPDKSNNLEPYPVNKVHKDWVTNSTTSCLEHLERVWFGQAKAHYNLESPEEGYKLTVDISLTRRAMVKSAEEQKPPTVKKPWYARAYLWWLGLDKD